MFRPQSLKLSGNYSKFLNCFASTAKLVYGCPVQVTLYLFVQNERCVKACRLIVFVHANTNDSHSSVSILIVMISKRPSCCQAEPSPSSSHQINFFVHLTQALIVFYFKAQLLNPVIIGLNHLAFLL